jgi:hypothetical protein
MIDSVVIAFGFRARSGKDTAVAEIIKQRGLKLPIYNMEDNAANAERYDVRRYAFADALKREVNQAAIEAGGMEKLFLPNRRFAMCKGYYMDFPDWVQYDPNAPMDDPLCPMGKQRTLLQWYGSEYRRADDDTYWIRQLEQTIELEKPTIAILSDLRFPNEMDWVLRHGEAVRVDRDSLPPATHISETALQDSTDWSLILENNGTLEELLEGAVVAFDELMLNFPYGHNKVKEVASA